MLVALGIHSHDVYVDEFETPFLVSTAEYYRCLSMCFLVSNSASLYVKKVTWYLILFDTKILVIFAGFHTYRAGKR